MLFLDCSTQWRHAGMTGVPTGLDMAGVAGVMQLTGRQGSPELFADLRIMEGEAVTQIQKRWNSK